VGRGEAVRDLLVSRSHGVLATLSARHGGWPFASLAPYAVTEAGEPILLLSALAEHTRNLQRDARASLFVQADDGDDPQASARVTLLGTVEQTSEADAKDRYLQRHPQAADYFELKDFGLYVLRPTAARFVQGFGEMGWLDAAALSPFG